MIANIASLLLVGALGADAFSMPEAASSFTSLLSSSLNNAIPNALIARRGGSGGCPAIWTTISSDLTSSFLGSDGQCTDLARAAIRFAFHDAGKSFDPVHTRLRI
jgi:hypothetical protein